MGIALNSFARNWLLRRPWANLARFLRDHSPVWVFGWAYFRSPCSCSFSCSFLVCIDIHLLSIDFPLNPKGNWRMSKILNSCACPCIFLSENVCSFGFTYSHIVFPCPCWCFWQGGMDYGSTLDLKLAPQELHENSQCYKYKLDAELPHKHEIYTLLQFPLRKT